MEVETNGLDMDTLEPGEIEGPSKKMFIPAPGERVIQYVTLEYGLTGQIETCGHGRIRWLIFNELYLLQTATLHRGIQRISCENADHDMKCWVNAVNPANGKTNGETFQVVRTTSNMFPEQAVAV